MKSVSAQRAGCCGYGQLLIRVFDVVRTWWRLSREAAGGHSLQEVKDEVGLQLAMGKQHDCGASDAGVKSSWDKSLRFSNVQVCMLLTESAVYDLADIDDNGSSSSRIFFSLTKKN